ncbi:MAG: FUSC family protein, partial [Desulfobacterales bacterium]|nr:FUSC family protein [Desulfobacterales bacterium]
MAFEPLSRLMGELRPGSPLFRHALRAAVAITAAVVLVRQLKLHHALWVPITVLVVMRPSLGGTLNISWRRMAGTLAGVILGVLLAYLHLPAFAVAGLAFAMLFWMFYFKDRNYIIF